MNKMIAGSEQTVQQLLIQNEKLTQEIKLQKQKQNSQIIQLQNEITTLKQLCCYLLITNTCILFHSVLCNKIF